MGSCDPQGKQAGYNLFANKGDSRKVTADGINTGGGICFTAELGLLFSSCYIVSAAACLSIW